MTNTMTVANTIYQQLGGNRFAVMTGAKYFLDLGDGLRFRIGKNASKANMVEIRLNALDLYDVKFIKHTPYKFNVKTMKETEEKTVVLAHYEDCYNDMIVELFERYTGMYAHL